MLTNEKIKEVKRLLASGSSIRRAASLTGVSRNFVSKIAKGKRTETERTVEFPRNGPIERCPGCGRKIMMPCHACLIEFGVRYSMFGIRRSVTNAGPEFRTPNTESRIPLFLGVNLKNEEKIRYEKIKAWRQSQPNLDFVHLPENWPFWRSAEN